MKPTAPPIITRASAPRMREHLPPLLPIVTNDSHAYQDVAGLFLAVGWRKIIRTDDTVYFVWADS